MLYQTTRRVAILTLYASPSQVIHQIKTLQSGDQNYRFKEIFKNYIYIYFFQF